MRSKRRKQLFDACERQVNALLAGLNETFKVIQASEDDQAMVDFESVMDATLEDAAAIARRVNASIEENDGTKAMRTAIRKAQARVIHRHYAMKTISKLHIGSPLDSWEQRGDRLRAIKEMGRSYSDIAEELGVDLDALKAELEATLRRWFDPLWAELATNRDAFVELFTFVAGGSDRSADRAQDYINGGISLDLNGWNDAVAIHKEDPILKDFIGLRADLKPSEVLRMAAEAKLDNNPTAIKIVLAYCKNAENAKAVGWLRQVLAEMAVLNDRTAKR